MKVSIPPFTFNSDFDSGNLDQAIVTCRSDCMGSSATLTSERKIPADYTIQLWTKSDGSLENPSKNRTWFHFSVTHADLSQDTTVLLHFINLNRVQRLFSQGMRPLFRYEGSQSWRRIPSRPFTKYVDRCMEMSFEFIFQPSQKTIYFAYCLPYTYENLQANLLALEMKFIRVSQPPTSRIPKPCRLADIYFHRDVLAKTFEGNNLDILTISSYDEITSTLESPPDNLFPIKSMSRPRMYTMKTKKFFFLTARVHPAETISSYMLDGFLDFILSTDPRAVFLRKSYIFKIIPMLNPDGVIRGNYRGDHDGMNLNRVYNSPNQILHPTIFATKSYTNYIMTLGQINFYFDFHGHANKSGSFLFGNWINNIQQQMDILRFTKYCMIHNPLFSFEECDFGPIQTSTVELEQAKEGTSRVAMHKLTEATKTFTFEANYYGHKVKNGTRRFSSDDVTRMGVSIALAAYEVTKEERFGCEKDDDMQHWIESKLISLYEKVGKAIPAELSKL